MKQASSSPLRRGVVMSALGILALVAGGASAAQTARVKESLTATAAAPGARGKARLALKSSKHGHFTVTAKRLEGARSFDVIVGGVKVGSLQTNAGGSGRARFSTTPSAKQSLLGFDPQGQQLLVRDEEDGEDVLVGDLPDDDPASVACCVTEGEGEGESESETECEDLTPEECQAANGVVQAVASCLPDPCATTPAPGEEIVCCTNATHDDESEAECEDVANAADCAASGGTVVEATSCDLNPCQVTPPANVSVCCIPETSDSGESEPAECEVLSAEACTAAGGAAAAGTTCDPDPCNPGV